VVFAETLFVSVPVRVKVYVPAVVPIVTGGLLLPPPPPPQPVPAIATRKTSRHSSARQLRRLAGIPKKSTLASAAPPAGMYQRLGRDLSAGTAIDVVVLRAVVAKAIVVEPDVTVDERVTVPDGVQAG